MMPGDDRMHEYAMDAADARADQMLDAVSAWVRNSGYSAAIGMILTGDSDYYDKDLDKALNLSLGMYGQRGLEARLASMLVEVQDEWAAGLTFGD